MFLLSPSNKYLNTKQKRIITYKNTKYTERYIYRALFLEIYNGDKKF